MIRRRLLNIASAGSLLILTVICVFWSRQERSDSLSVRFGAGVVRVDSMGGLIYVASFGQEKQTPRFKWHTGIVDPGRDGISNPLFRVMREPKVKAYGVAFPHGLAAFLALILPATTSALFLKRQRRRQKGQCSACGYDLRATGDRCPECGTPAPRRLEVIA